jgi:glycosyltransferase involved in cell wall biosynthesis
MSVFFSPAFPRGAAVFLYVGRLAPEKNLEAFLRLDPPGRKRVVGDGPQRAELQARYPQVEFLGYRYGAELAEAYRSASVLVFPSLTDTLGLVMYEALACGTPVAAFPVAGPLDVLIEGRTGALDSDLRGARCARWRWTGGIARAGRRNSPGTSRAAVFACSVLLVERPPCRADVLPVSD